jgi:hypothetical protein
MVDGPECRGGRNTADFITPGRWSRIFRSPYCTAKFSTSSHRGGDAPAMAIATGADCDKTFGVLPVARSEHPRARPRYRGERSAVAAVDDATGGRALLIKPGVRRARLLHRTGRRARRSRYP